MGRVVRERHGGFDILRKDQLMVLGCMTAAQWRREWMKEAPWRERSPKSYMNKDPTARDHFQDHSVVVALFSPTY
jgi:hypothetical protein